MSSVVLDEGVAEDIVADMRQFLSGSEWYIQRGIPYRRGYLLWGPPGCGKTSLIMALAGELGLKVMILNLASKDMEDESLFQLMSAVSNHSLVLLEDIDAAFSQRASGDDNKSTITFSGLLNALDGIAASEGRIVSLRFRVHPACTLPMVWCGLLVVPFCWLITAVFT